MTALGQKQTFAVQNGDVRFTPDSGHQAGRLRCPLCANSCHRRLKPRGLRRRAIGIYPMHTVIIQSMSAGDADEFAQASAARHLVTASI